MKYKYVLRFFYKTRLHFDCPDITHQWFQVRDGELTIKSGYAWDGCSPKVKIKDWFYLGTWDGVPDENGDQILKYCSIVHDVTYQFIEVFKGHGVSRKDLDEDFLKRMEEVNFSGRKIYYWVVRLLGWTYAL